MFINQEVNEVRRQSPPKYTASITETCNNTCNTGLSTHRQPKEKGEICRWKWVRAGAVLQEAGLCLGGSLLCSQTHLPCEVLCPLSDSNLSSHIPGSSFPLTSKVEIRTQKPRQNQIHSPSCVSRGTSPAQILYRKFPLLSKNSRPLCMTLLLKIWSPAFSSSSFLSLGNPSLSIPLAPLQVPVG